jgi:small subunit ribosomal protein S15
LRDFRNQTQRTTGLDEEKMAVTKERRSEIIAKFQKKSEDTGSPEVQIALLTERMKELHSHMESHKKDHSSRRGLLKMVSQRASLLKYVKAKDPSRYVKIIGELGLRK